ncbi:hypothetical protein BDW59DRAFT_156111 [Aspergillus cavernicola]|uniref:Uncharacterized protein n=1 Tax=Aspergillus cavernicola TaxID=176166 RepID=A0ABR4J5H4_9EURO
MKPVTLWALALTLTSTPATLAQTPEWHAHYRMTPSEYQQTFDHYTSLGYVLNSVSGYERASEANYAAIFEQTDRGAWRSNHGMTSAEYVAKNAGFEEQGYHVRQVNGYNVDGEAVYAAIWEVEPEEVHKRITYHNLTASEMQERVDCYMKEGYRPSHISGYEIGGSPYFAVIFEYIADDAAWWAWGQLSSSEYQARFDEYLADGYRLRDVSGYSVGDDVFFVGIWDNSTAPGAWSARHGMDSSTFQSEFDKFKGEGYVLEVLSGYSTGAGDRYAALWAKA